MAQDIGIDLGTTFSALAVVGNVQLSPDYPADGIYLQDCNVTIIPSPYGEPTFPSIIADDPNESGSYLFGADAAAVADSNGEPILFAKRYMGTDHEFSSHAGSLTAVDVAALFLKHLRDCAELALGEPVARALITHPAHFDRTAVEATRTAAITAGFDMSLPEQLLMEPVAAALTYTASDQRDPLRVLAYDLGGGTFDVSFMERNSGVMEMRAFQGDNLLGGFNFDRTIVQWIIDAVRARGRSVTLKQQDAAATARLLQLAERTKLDLADSTDPSQRINIRGRGVLRDQNGREVPIDASISRSEFEPLIAQHLDKTIEHCQRTLEMAEVSVADIDLILLVGGSTRGPWVADALAAAFPDAQCNLFEPDLCVAAGAALYGSRILPRNITGEACTIVLDTPAESSMEEVDISGVVKGAAPGWQVVLTTAGLEPASLPVPEDQTFLFSDQLLANEGANAFTIQVLNTSGEVVLSHDLSISYAPDGEATTITSVLPRALLIETVNGMIPIAPAGADLPARCEETFERQNNNPNITLRLYQDRTAVGEVQIENIPQDGGIGAKVNLRLDINPNGELTGEAEIVAPSSERIVVTTPVSVHIDAVQVPQRADLEQRYQLLTTQWQAVRDSNAQRFQDLDDYVQKKFQRVDELLAEFLENLQEIEAAVADAEQLVETPADKLDPPMADFQSLIQSVQDAITNSIAEDGVDDSTESSSRDVERAQRVAHAKAKKFKQTLAELIAAGESAYEERNRRRWGSTYSALQMLLGQALERRTKQQDTPALVTRLQGSMYVNDLITRLNSAADRLRSENRLADWQSEVRRIFNGLHAALQRILEITDVMDSNQALAIRRQAEQSVQPLVSAINSIGVDIGLVGEASYVQGESVETTAAEDVNAAVSLLGAGHSSLAEVLAGGAAVVDHANEQGNTPLIMATEAGDPVLVRELLAKGADLEHQNELGRTALFFCTTAAMAECLLDAGAVVDARDHDLVTPLMICANEGRCDVLKVLVAAGAKFDSRWSTGQTAVIIAAGGGQVEAVAELIRFGADLEAVDNNLRTALLNAADAGHTAVVELLLQGGAVVDTADFTNASALFLAAHKGHVETVAALLASNANTQVLRAEDSGSALMIASWEGHRGVVELLIPCSDLDHADKDGDTALINATHHGHRTVVDLLIRAGAAVNASNHSGQTALIIAAQSGAVELVESLLAGGADTSCTDHQGHTALSYALASEQADTVALLTPADT